MGHYAHLKNISLNQGNWGIHAGWSKVAIDYIPLNKGLAFHLSEVELPLPKDVVTIMMKETLMIKVHQRNRNDDHVYFHISGFSVTWVIQMTFCYGLVSVVVR